MLSSEFLLTTPFMWKIIYEYACPLGQPVTKIVEISSKRSCCCLVAVGEVPACEVYCLSLLVLWSF